MNTFRTRQDVTGSAANERPANGYCRFVDVDINILTQKQDLPDEG